MYTDIREQVFQLGGTRISNSASHVFLMEFLLPLLHNKHVLKIPLHTRHHGRGQIQ